MPPPYWTTWRYDDDIFISSSEHGLYRNNWNNQENHSSGRRNYKCYGPTRGCTFVRSTVCFGRIFWLLNLLSMQLWKLNLYILYVYCYRNTALISSVSHLALLSKTLCKRRTCIWIDSALADMEDNLQVNFCVCSLSTGTFHFGFNILYTSVHFLYFNVTPVFVFIFNSPTPPP